jgi:hypothetical protein
VCPHAACDLEGGALRHLGPLYAVCDASQTDSTVQ